MLIYYDPEQNILNEGFLTDEYKELSMHIPQRHVLFSPIETFCLTILINRGRVFTFHFNLCIFFLMVKCNIELLFVNCVCVRYTFITGIL